MRVKAAMWGNSLAVRLPKAAVRALNLKPGQDMTVDVGGGRISLAPQIPKPRIPTLAELCAQARRLGPEHEPDAVDWGPDVGEEIIEDEGSRGDLSPPKLGLGD